MNNLYPSIKEREILPRTIGLMESPETNGWTDQTKKLSNIASKFISLNKVDLEETNPTVKINYEEGKVIGLKIGDNNKVIELEPEQITSFAQLYLNSLKEQTE